MADEPTKEQITEEIIGQGNYALAREVWLKAELEKISGGTQ